MAKGNGTTTHRLWTSVSRTANVHTFIKQNENHFITPDLAAQLNLLRTEKNMIKEHIINRAGLEETYGHEIFRGKKHPSREKLIQLAFGFPLTVEETQRIFLCANKRLLHPRIKRDAAIIFCLEKGKSFMELQELLFDLNLPLIGDDT